MSNNEEQQPEKSYLEKRREHIQNGRPLKEKKKYYIPKVSKKRAEQLKKDKESGTKPVGKLELDKWFDDIRKHETAITGYGVCMECNQCFSLAYFRHATAHLLPKKLFTSVATHPLNYLILGAGCGCHEKTHRIDKFIQMKVWPEAAKRIKIMIPLLPFDELKHLSNQLLIALDNTD